MAGPGNGQARQSERPSSILKGGKMRKKKETGSKDAVGGEDLMLRKTQMKMAYDITLLK